jgi:hypothetical protein
MPPQQCQRLLDFVDERLGFRAHEIFHRRKGAGCEFDWGI